MFLREVEQVSLSNMIEGTIMNRLLAEDSEKPPMYQSIIGIILMIIGAVCTNLGNNLMSLGHSQQRELEQYKADQEVKRQKSGLSVDSLDKLPSIVFAQ